MNYSKEFQEWKEWVSQNKLKSIGSLWLGLMASNICYQFTRPVPLQLKLIHSRVYSQFVTIAAVGVIGLAETLDPSMKKKRGGDY